MTEDMEKEVKRIRKEVKALDEYHKSVQGKPIRIDDRPLLLSVIDTLKEEFNEEHRAANKLNQHLINAIKINGSLEAKLKEAIIYLDTCKVMVEALEQIPGHEPIIGKSGTFIIDNYIKSIKGEQDD